MSDLTRCLVACLLATSPAWVLAGDAPARQEDMLVIRIAVDDVPAALRSEIDPCAIDPGRRAVFFLSPKRVRALQAAGVPLEVVSSLRDHLRDFAPQRTLQNKPIPALDMLGPGSAAARQARGGDPCADIGTSLEPYNQYHNLEEGVCFIHNLAEAHPEITQLMTIGTSVEGRDIWALKITDQPQASEPDEDKILFTGVTHAREWATHETVLYMAEYLTSRYDSDRAVKHIVDHSEVWLVPAVNPDGYVYTWTDFRMWRKNRANVDADPEVEGVDINRNYDFNWGPGFPGSSSNPQSETYRGPAAASEPETQAIQALLAEQRFTISVSFHTYGQYVLFPWGYTTRNFPQSYTALRASARKYSALVKHIHDRHYTAGQGSYTLYRTNGDFDDYAYGVHGALSFTPELRPQSSSDGGFVLPENHIKPNNEENMAAALWLMTNVATTTELHNPASPTLIENVGNGGNRFSLPLPPTNAKPEIALGFPVEHGDLLTTYVSNSDQQPSGAVTYPDGFKGCGPGREYLVQVSSDLQDWAFGLTSYRALPYTFFDGAEVQLSRYGPLLQFAAVPGHAAVRLDEVQVIERVIDEDGQEIIQEQRSALQDLNHRDPWLSWTWTWRDAAGVDHEVHPTGANGASEVLLPFRSYSFLLFVPSFNFGGFFQSTYLLRFPGKPFADCNFNGQPDDQDIAAGLSDDCSGDGRPDECDPDCNTNGVADSCDIAGGSSVDEDRNGVPDECSPPLLRVPQDHPTIQAALDAAEAGQSIIVEDGVYSGVGNRDLDFLGKDLLLTSRSGPQACIIDCEGLGRGVTFNAGPGSAAHLRGFTIRNGAADRGAALSCAGGASPTISDCLLIDNVASAQGGGLYTEEDCHPQMLRCDFRGNQATFGGGAFVGSDSDPRFESCVFSGNSAFVGGAAGSPAPDSAPRFVNCTMSANTATGQFGGGLYLSSPDIRVANCVLWHNATADDAASPQSQIYSTADAVQLSYSIVEGLQAEELGVGNLGDDPLFRDPLGPDGFAGTTDDDLRLLGDSPARDAGDNSAIGVELTTDLDGHPRIISGTIDMGAYEFFDVPLSIVSSDPPDGAIDARQPSQPDGSAVDGWSVVRVTFNDNAAMLGPDDFELMTSADDDSVTITEVSAAGHDLDIVLSAVIPVGECTTLLHIASGTRIELGYLPGDVDANGFSSPGDILALIDGLNGVIALAPWQCDVNRSGFCEPSDILRLVDVLNGVGVYGGWTQLPACP